MNEIIIGDRVITEATEQAAVLLDRYIDEAVVSGLERGLSYDRKEREKQLCNYYPRHNYVFTGTLWLPRVPPHYLDNPMSFHERVVQWAPLPPHYLDKVKNQPPDLTAGEFNRSE